MAWKNQRQKIFANNEQQDYIIKIDSLQLLDNITFSYA